MKPVFADTYFWIAGTDPHDNGHELALDFAQSPQAIVTTEEVLVEYLNYFAKRGIALRLRAASRVQLIAKSRAIYVIPQTGESFQLGLSLYLRRMDKGYSLTDCISMETMRRERIIDALTNDAHFAQEGFRAVFREER
jgi:predicted nucleic acid-binding protein